MAHELVLGAKLRLPLDAITQTFGILAVRGAGKSNLAAVMAEEMFTAKLPFVVIDPVGSWYGLRSDAHGKGRGLPVPIFGGKHGDVPLERTSGELLADLVVDKRLSCVVDTSTFDSETTKKAFLLAFAQRLYKRNEQPLHLFLEEADDYIPQRPMREEAHLLRAWENIVRRGRARGLGITLITQRSAALNKNVLTQIETLFAMRTTGPHDRKAIEEWVHYHAQSKQLLDSLPGLENGEAWCWSPSWLQRMERVHIRRRNTFDSGATPKHLLKSKPVATLADIDLPALQSEWSSTIERAKADDPRELRRRIAELEKKATTPIEQSPVDRSLLKDLERTEVALDRTIKSLVQTEKKLDRIEANLKACDDLINRLKKVVGAEPRIAAPTGHAQPGVEPRGGGSRRPMRGTDSSMGRCERMILTALAQNMRGRTRTQIAILTGYSSKGGGFLNALSKLRTSGWTTQLSDGTYQITDTGHMVLGRVEPLPRGKALLDHWLAQLGKCERQCLVALTNAYPDPLSREDVARAAGYEPKGGGFLNALSKLRTLELVESSHHTVFGKPMLKASNTLFL